MRILVVSDLHLGNGSKSDDFANVPKKGDNFDKTTETELIEVEERFIEL